MASLVTLIITHTSSVHELSGSTQVDILYSLPAHIPINFKATMACLPALLLASFNGASYGHPNSVA